MHIPTWTTHLFPLAKRKKTKREIKSKKKYLTVSQWVKYWCNHNSCRSLAPPLPWWWSMHHRVAIRIGALMLQKVTQCKNKTHLHNFLNSSQKTGPFLFFFWSSVHYYSLRSKVHVVVQVDGPRIHGVTGGGEIDQMWRSGTKSWGSQGRRGQPLSLR